MHIVYGHFNQGINFILSKSISLGILDELEEEKEEKYRKRSKHLYTSHIF